MKKALISNIFISCLMIIPLLLKTTGFHSDITDILVSGLRPLFIFLIAFNIFGLICLETVAKFANYIDTKELLEHNDEQEKLENHPAFKAYRLIMLTFLFGLLMYNQMFLTTIFACIWWLSRHLFKINFNKFIKNLK